MPFTPCPEHELVDLDDDALIAHARAAREHGNREQAVLAIRVLVFGYWPRVKQRVALKIPKEDVEDVASDVLESAITSAFRGASTGEFIAWLNTISQRRIADYHRRREGKPTTTSLSAGEDEDLDLPAPSEAGYAETQMVITQVLATLKETHRTAVEQHVLDQRPAKEVGVELGLSEDNVAQIASRFRRKLRAALEGGDVS